MQRLSRSQADRARAGENARGLRAAARLASTVRKSMKCPMSSSHPKALRRNEVSDAVRGAAGRVGDAIEKGRKPGMPLSILSNIAKEAPLGSLLVGFLLGSAVARRR